MDLVPVTSNVWMLRFEVVNAYLVRVGSAFALIDSGPVGSEGAILGALATLEPDPALSQIVLTHSHRDHAGSAAALAATTGAEVLAGDRDADVVAGTACEQPPVITAEERPFYESIAGTIPAAPPVEVSRRLGEGDDLGWDCAESVIEVPGHTAGSIAVHLPTERVLFTGDNIASLGDRAILGPFNVAPDDAVESFRKLASLDVDIACCGHGEPIMGQAGRHLQRAADHV